MEKIYVCGGILFCGQEYANLILVLKALSLVRVYDLWIRHFLIVWQGGRFGWICFMVDIVFNLDYILVDV